MAGTKGFEVEDVGMANTPPATSHGLGSTSGSYNLDAIGPQNAPTDASYRPGGNGIKNGPSELEQPGGTNAACGASDS